MLPFSHGGPEQVLLLILFFSAAALEWLTRPEVADAALKERYALRLLAMCGGLVALVSANLAGLWLGLSLYRLATDLAASHPSRRPLALYLLALQALFWGLVMISVAGGPLYLTSLRRWIWQMGVPPSPPFLAGVGLAMGGILLATELIPLCDVLKGEGALAGPALGVALLLRLLLA
ncbi:MAG: hypothetical protein H5U01_15930, partial [Clostridia bacterium]|nr:hypothetical protein [Clostridia bacterium]